MGHNWQPAADCQIAVRSADRRLSKDWLRCEKCGQFYCTGIDDEGPPTPETVIAGRTCEQAIEQQATDVYQKMHKLLLTAGTHNPYPYAAAPAVQEAVRQKLRILLDS